MTTWRHPPQRSHLLLVQAPRVLEIKSIDKRKTSLRYLGGIIAVALLISACVRSAQEESAADGSNHITIMTFNVENLFDTRHDQGKEDYTYLPLSNKNTAEHARRCEMIQRALWRKQCHSLDWSDRVLAVKLEHLARAILQVNDGRGPDLLVLQEVENRRVLENLRNNFLQNAQFEASILLEGEDRRGIDVAFLSRLPKQGPPRLHTIPVADGPSELRHDARGILEATFSLPDGQPLTVLGVHFPAPFHHRQHREQAMRYLNQLRARLPHGRMIVAAGDFNITADESDILASLASPFWLISHQSGCGNCRGTYFYRAEQKWSFLDIILLSTNLAPQSAEPASWLLIPQSIRLANGAHGQVALDRTPQRFDATTMRGVSDHWPLALELRRRPR